MKKPEVRAAMRNLVLSACLAVTLSCASAKKAPSEAMGPQPLPAQGPQEVMGPQEAYGPQAAVGEPSGSAGGASSATPTPGFGPEPIQFRSLVLVLGPGGAKGFAHVGVIKALQEKKIPIGAVLGTEMGALVGTAYAMGGNANQMVFSMQRFNAETLKKDSDGLAKWVGAGRFESALKQVFGDKDLMNAKVPVRITIEMIDSGKPGIVDKGGAALIVRAAMSGPGFLGGETMLGSLRARNAIQSRPFPIAEARALGIGPVVAIDVGGAPGSAQSALSDADLVLRPSLKAIGAENFDRKSDAIYQGRKIVLENLAQLRQWAGMPND